MAAPFFWGEGGRALSYEELQQMRDAEERRASRGSDYSPVGHWTQGAARVADALAGVVRQNRLAGQLAASDAAGSRAIGEILGGSFGSPGSAPGSVPGMPPAQPRPRAAPVQTPSAPIMQAPPQSGSPAGVPPNVAMGADARAMMAPQLAAGSSVPQGGMSVANAGRGFTDYNMPDGSVMRRQGTFAWRNNNPGNIEDGRFASSQPGYLPGGGRFAAFDTLENGNAARERLMFDSPSYRNLPLSAAINRYAPPFENNTGNYVAQLAQAAGVSPQTIMSQMTPEQRSALMAAQNRVEGHRPGREITLSQGSGMPAPSGPVDGPSNIPALAMAPQSAPMGDMMPVPQRPGGVPTGMPQQAPMQVASLDPSAGIAPVPPQRPQIPPQMAAAPTQAPVAAQPQPAPQMAPQPAQAAPQASMNPMQRITQALGAGVPAGGHRVGQFAGQDQLAGARASGSLGALLGRPAPSPAVQRVTAAAQAAPQPSAQSTLPQNAQPTQGAPIAPQMQPQPGPQMAGGADPQRLIQIVSDPRMPPQARQMAAQELQRLREQATPEYRLKMEKAQVDLDNAKSQRTDDIKEYEYAKQQGFTGSFNDFQLRMAEARRSQVNIGGTGSQVFDAVAKSAEGATAAANGLNAIREARAAVDAGGIFGAGADVRLGMQKIGALLGVGDPQAIVNTETFRSAIAPQVASLMKATVGSTQISNADREFAEKAAGGSIALEPASIKRLLDIMERAGNAAIEAHNRKLDLVYPDDGKSPRERALFRVQAPEMKPMTPPAAQGGVQEGATATNPQTGQKVIYRNGQWVPAQ